MTKEYLSPEAETAAATTAAVEARPPE
jgi:hypothetical protein